jgi:hypothetical protein
MELRQAKLQMIDAVPGGWDVAAVYLGMSTNALRNRIYEVKDQKLSDEKSLALQQLSKTTHYADAIAQASGGVFVRLPDVECENEDLMRKFNELYVCLGNFSRDFDTALSNDGVIDKREEVILEHDVQQLQKSLAEVFALMLRVYGVNQPGAGNGAR